MSYRRQRVIKKVYLLSLFLIILSFSVLSQSAYADSLDDNSNTEHEQVENITEESPDNVYSDEEAHISHRTSPVYLAKKWLRLKPRESHGNNVVKVKRRLAPFNINDEWCASFVTYLWGKSGYSRYLSARYIWRTSSGFRVAVNVKSLYSWAKRTGQASRRAAAGYGVVYKFPGGRWHIGLVTKARNGKGITSIEGNVKNTVKKVRIKRKYVVGYISP